MPSYPEEREPLLNSDERVRVRVIEAEMKPFKDEAAPLVQAKINAQAEQIKLYNLSDIAGAPQEYLDKILSESGGASTPEAYQTRVLTALEQLESELQDVPQAYLEFVQAFKKTIKTQSLPADVDDMYGAYYELLDETFGDYSATIPDYDWQDKLQGALEAQNTIVDESTKVLDAIKVRAEACSKENHLGCEVDANLDLIKISRKRTEGLRYSVLYVKGDDKQLSPTAYAMFGGKDGQLVGKGGFGRVKRCQNLETGTWRAIKIEDNRERDQKSFENRVLDKLERYYGETLRGDKYYAMQSLLPGEDLDKHLKAGIDANVASRLEIAKQAAELIKAFHQEFLHRDIKPKNFVWDEKEKALTLCDFGASSPLGEKKIEAFGSEGYIAPELLDPSPEGEDVFCTKKSDMYALGKTFEEIFKDVKEVPEGVEALIQHMIEPDPDKRTGDMDEVIATLNEAEQYRLQM
jgi:hypothetical protein